MEPRGTRLPSFPGPDLPTSANELFKGNGRSPSTSDRPQNGGSPRTGSGPFFSTSERSRPPLQSKADGEGLDRAEVEQFAPRACDTAERFDGLGRSGEPRHDVPSRRV